MQNPNFDFTDDTMATTTIAQKSPPRVIPSGHYPTLQIGCRCDPGDLKDINAVGYVCHPQLPVKVVINGGIWKAYFLHSHNKFALVSECLNDPVRIVKTLREVMN